MWPPYIEQPHIPPPPQQKLLATAGPPAPLITPALPVAPRSPASVPEGNTLKIPKVSRAPQLADFLTHTPREAEARVSDFRQRSPGDGTPATQPTAAFLSYDNHNLYVVFECTDEAGKIRAHMSKRDDIGDDDQVAVYLDTFRDGQRAYVFSANPYGIQNDAVLTEGGGSDSKFDTLWYTEAKLIDNGYVVWMAIPFKSVRFTGQDIQNWGIALPRSLVRRNEGSIWPFISKKRERFIKYFAGMEGMQDISPGRNVQLIPYINAARAQTLAPQGLVGDHDIRGGVDGKAVFRNALTLDFTVNPDFSQVESDDPQVTINQRYEVYFPEKRPFFLENSAYFQTPFNLFFSRRIVDPEFGARLTGKVGDWALGFMGTDDRATGQTQSAGSPYFGDRSKIGIFRVQREFKNQSHIGAFATSNDFGSSWNRVAAVDARINMTPNWYVSGQLVKSFDRQLNGTETSGTAAKADLTYVDRHLSYTGDYTDLTPDFKAPLGFIRRVDLRQTSQYVGYFWQPEDQKVLSFGPAISYLMDWDHPGNFRTGRSMPISASTSPARSDSTPPATMRSSGISARAIGTREAASRSMRIPSAGCPSTAGSDGNGHQLHTGRRGGSIPRLQHGCKLGFTLRPSPSLTFTQYYYYTRLGTRTNTLPMGAQPGSLFNNHLLRWKFNYQFSKALSVRTIVDYYALLPNPSLFYSDKYKQLTGDVLFTYLINPGTALYFGYNNRYENLMIDPTIPPALRRIAAINDLSSRQFFVKLSYLLRF